MPAKRTSKKTAAKKKSPAKKKSAAKKKSPAKKKPVAKKKSPAKKKKTVEPKALVSVGDDKKSTLDRLSIGDLDLSGKELVVMLTRENPARDGLQSAITNILPEPDRRLVRDLCNQVFRGRNFASKQHAEAAVAPLMAWGQTARVITMITVAGGTASVTCGTT